MPKTLADHTFTQALELEKSIKSMAFNPKYDSAGYRTRVLALRDCITELAMSGEFGKLKKIAEYSLDLLEPHSTSGNRRYHCLRPADLIHHLETFPTHQDALVNDISSDKNKNRIVVNSIIKSDAMDSEGMGLAARKIAAQLAKACDKEAWLAFVQGPDDRLSSYNLATDSIGLFDLKYLEENKHDFSVIKSLLRYKPNSFGWGTSDDTKVDSTALFDALLTLGCKNAIPEILKVCWLEFKEPFMLQRNMERYGFAPDDEYRQVLADSVHVSDSRYRHLATSYYLHELSRDETLLPQKRAMSPAILAEVIELDGKDTPYGTFHFKPGKIGQVIDVTLRAALQQDDWNKVSKDYDEIPRKLLMKSNVYKGRILCDELGM